MSPKNTTSTPATSTTRRSSLLRNAMRLFHTPKRYEPTRATLRSFARVGLLGTQFV